MNPVGSRKSEARRPDPFCGLKPTLSPSNPTHKRVATVVREQPTLSYASREPLGGEGGSSPQPKRSEAI